MKKNNKTKQFYETLISSYKNLTQEEDFNANKMRKNYEEICSLFCSFSDLWETKKKLRVDLGISFDNNFNIFTSIAEYYWYENLHSDILKNILDPFTPVIGNPEFLKCFLELIKIDPKTFNYQSASVEREAEKIDLLIYDEKSAIIIENKINFACDQPNQLPRYYEKITNPNGIYKKKVIKIVYITLSNKKNPTFDYSEEYRCYGQNIKNCLLHVAAVNKPTNQFAANFMLSNKNGFLSKLIEIENESEKNENEKNTSIVYLQQYKQLLNYLGEQEIMNEINEQIAELMFKTEDSSNMTKEIIDIYNNKYLYLGNICLKKILNEKPKKYIKIDDNDQFIGKKINDTEYAYFAVENEGNNKIYSYGFYNPKKDWLKKDQNTFSLIMNTDNVASNSEYVYKYLSFRELEEEIRGITIEKLTDFIKGLLESLIKSYNSKQKIL